MTEKNMLIEGTTAKPFDEIIAIFSSNNKRLEEFANALTQKIDKLSSFKQYEEVKPAETGSMVMPEGIIGQLKAQITWYEQIQHNIEKAYIELDKIV